MSRVANKLQKATSTASGGFTARYIRLTGFTRSVSVGPFISQFALYTDADLTNLIIGQEASTNPTIPELSANYEHSSYPARRAGSAVDYYRLVSCSRALPM